MLSCPYIVDRTLSHNHNVSVAHLGAFGKGGSSKINHAIGRIVLSLSLKIVQTDGTFPRFPENSPQKSDNQPSILKKAS